jgi:hypothetical protein
MEKKLRFLFGMFLILGVFLMASANNSYAGAIFLGTVVESDLPYMGTDLSTGVENVSDVNALIAAWNYNNEGTMQSVSNYSEDYWNFTKNDEEGKSGTITWEGNWKYLTVKYAGVFDLFYIAGDEDNSIDWESQWIPLKNDKLQQHAISHVRLWDGSASSVPEPATMLLLGSGLIGLAALGKKNFFK